jgi:hypothetical protein
MEGKDGPGPIICQSLFPSKAIVGTTTKQTSFTTSHKVPGVFVF